MRQSYLLLGILLCVFHLRAQVNDNFSDGDFTTGTIWSGVHSLGNNNPFEIAETDNQLKSQSISGGSGTRVSYLSTTDAQDLSSTTAEWNFRFRLGFSRPSSASNTTNGNNTSRVYLMSNTANLAGNVNGYYVELRYPGTSDFNDVRLYRQDAGTTTELAVSGTVQSVTSMSFATVKVTRSEAGLWEVTVNSTSQGTVTDNTYNSTTHFGVQVRYSANSRSDDFFFDDFATTYTAVADTDPPTITSSSANSATEVVLDFSENLNQTSAETASNYSFNNGVTVTSATLNASDNSKVTLTVSGLTSGTTYTITVNNVQDLSNNPVAAGSTTAFEYIEFSTAAARNVVINELMVDPSPVVGLPEAEFIELYNPTNNFYQLENWAVSDDNSPTTSEKFSSFILRPKSYVIICDDAHQSLFTGFGSVIAVTTLGSLSNTGDKVVLSDGSGTIIDQITYANAPADGKTYEQINPDLPCSGEFNFRVSTHANGGTPGSQNTVFDNTPDTTKPQVSSLKVVDKDSIQITYSEPLDQGSVSTSSFSLSGYTISKVSVSSDVVVNILLSTNLVSEATYVMNYSGIKDCSGNSLSNASTSFYYDITPPKLGRLVVATKSSFFLVFNEPLSKTEAETESNYSLDQNFGAPSRSTQQDTATTRVLLSFGSKFQEGTTYTLTYNALKDTTGNAVSSSNVAFTFQDHIDSVKAISNNILEIVYTQAPSNSSAKQVKNYLLDGLGNPSEIINGANDRTYRLIFSNAINDNADLLLYVENVLALNTTDTLITPAFSFRYDTNSPTLSELTVVNATQLRLIFNEALEENSATNLNYYQLEDKEMPVNANLSTDTVTLTFADNFELEQKKTLTYTQISDLFGNTFTTNRTRDFTYDPLAPRVDSLYQIGDNTVSLWASEPLLLSSVDVNNFKADGISPSSFELKGPDSVELNLTFSAALTEASSLTFEITAWQDQVKNNLSEPLATSFNTLAPRVGNYRFTSDSTLELTFGKAMHESAYQSANYSINSQVISSVSDLGNNTAKIEIEASFKDGDVNIINLYGMTSTTGHNLQFDQLNVPYETYLKEIKVVDSLTLELQFETDFQTFSTSSIQVNGQTPTLASINPEDHKRVQLLLSKALVKNQQGQLSWTNLTDIYGRSLPDHKTFFNYDVASPTLSAVASKLEGAIRLTFSEPLDTEASSSLAQYVITGVGSPGTLTFQNDSLVQLVFPSLNSGTDYELIVFDFPDVAGNYATSDTIKFSYAPPAIIPSGAIVISEIMADPSPVVGLPEAEYVELKNISGETWNLASLRLSNDSDTVRLIEYLLGSGESVALVDEDDVSLFASFNVLGLDGLFSLDNSGELLVLSNINDILIDSLTYSSDWYGDPDRNDGGYSLELISPDLPCSMMNSWGASTSELGGTPGTTNAIPLDSVSPKVVETIFVDNQLVLEFSEEMLISSLVQEAISLDFEILDFSYNEKDQRATVNFDPSIGLVQELHITLSDVSDCSGNVIQDTTFTFIQAQPPLLNEVIITEIMADPEPEVGLPGREYLEIFNRSDRILDLNQLVIQDGSGISAPIGGVILPGTYQVLLSSSGVSDFPGVTVNGVGSMPGLSNGGERLALLYGDDLIFQITYSSDWHDGDKSEGGFSLEMRDVSNPCGQSENWGSSTAVAGGTPGQENSITQDVPDSFGPNLLQVIALGDDSIRLEFDEYLIHTLRPVLEVSGGIEVAESMVAIDDPRFVFVSLASPLELGVVYTIEVFLAQDCQGNAIQNSTADLVLPFEAENSQILLSEVLFNPRDNGVDFVEVFNTTDRFISMKNWALANLTQESQITTEDLIISPQSYLAFTEDVARLVLDYPNAAQEQLIEVADLPTFSNDQGDVFLVSSTGIDQDSLFYSEDFHSDLLRSVDGVSLERISFVVPNNGDNWNSASSTVGFATPGYANSQSLDLSQASDPVQAEPEVFVPGSGTNSFTTINYNFGSTGQFANISLYDQNGRFVKELARGVSLSADGFVRWDGTGANGGVVRVGYYVVVFEVFSSNGRSQVFKETVVVGRDF